MDSQHPERRRGEPYTPAEKIFLFVIIPALISQLGFSVWYLVTHR